MADVAPGSLIGGRYRARQRLGRGAYGAVFLAERIDDGASVALKVMHARLTETGDAARRFEREARLLGDLRHPNIVQLLDVGQTDDALPYIVFELLRGRTLRDELGRSPLSPGRCVEMTRQVLAALAAAHAVGITHRDIKPENIFLCDVPAGLVKVLDFGIAKPRIADAPTELTETGQMLGTPQYMPPEQVRGEPVDARSDLYALGTVMAEAVTGETLVHGHSQIDVFMIQISAEPLPIPEPLRSSLLGPVIARAVAKRPEERFPDAAAMAQALDAAAGVAPTTPMVAPTAPIVARTAPIAAATAPMSPAVRPPMPAPPSPRPASTRPASTRPASSKKGGVVIVAAVFGVVSVLAGIGLGIWVARGRQLRSADRKGADEAAAPSQSPRKKKSSASESAEGSAKEKSSAPAPETQRPLAGLTADKLRARLVRDGYVIDSESQTNQGDVVFWYFNAGRAGVRVSATLFEFASDQLADAVRHADRPGVAQKVEGRRALTLQSTDGHPETVLERLLSE